MGSEHYCLRWNNHQSNLLGVFSQLLEAESLVDVTLASSEGHSLRAHKVVLSACSSYFRALFLDHPARHPIVILKDVCFSELRTLVEFMYRGEVSVETCRLSALLKTAESLKVKGLAEMTALKAGGDDSHGGGEGNDGGGSPQHPAVVAQPIPAPDLPPPPPPPPSMEQQEEVRSPQGTTRDDDDASSVHSAPSDMTPPAPASPHSSEPVPGPSGLPPVQDAPLSLKKEVEWDRTDDKSMGETSSDYKLPHDPEVCLVEGEFGPGSSQSLDQISSSSRSSTPFQYPGLAGFAGLYGETVVSLLRAQGLDVPGVRCSVCLAAFPTTWLLDRHIQMQHPGHSSTRSPHTTEPMRDDKPFRCDQCGQSYRYRSAYIKHREQNHRARLPADKLFTCDVCGMQFRYLKSFKKHRLNHTLERLHTSPRRPPERDKDEGGCAEGQDEVTSSNEAVGRRSETSDQDDTVDSVSVEAGESSLIGLLRLNERQRPPRSFACPFCGKCVRSKENLKLHVRKHTGERPFACLFCGRAFGGKSDLTRHLRIHTGERPYHCEMCGKCFARADYLSKHLTTHIHQGQHR
ncbi:myeloid zinc finger 1-like isoform X2 [Cimex lectularius]|nr:myeloid zinc finger 1-like isoform X2 [Cimex lectularius]XP_014258551.1 myeloid zinc finger 1-like isoform X2 [Cimex lectularius]